MVFGLPAPLSGTERVLNKTIFWQNHAETVISDRQREVLNLYLDGYPGKLTAKNWAKRVKVSLDTAARDIKDLVEKGVLVPQQGRVRDVWKRGSWSRNKEGCVMFFTESDAMTLCLSFRN